MPSLFSALCLLSTLLMAATAQADSQKLTEQALLIRLPLAELQWLTLSATDPAAATEQSAQSADVTPVTEKTAVPARTELPFLTLIRDQARQPLQGTVILVPDPDSNPDQQPLLGTLRRQLNDKGWVTLALTVANDASSLLPMPLQPASRPLNRESSDKTANAKSEDSAGSADHTAPAAAEHTVPPPTLSPLAQMLQARLSAALQFAGRYPGQVVIYAEGRSAAATAQLLRLRAIPQPRALIVRAPFLPQAEQNQQLAMTLARSPVPVLDIHSRFDNRFAHATREERLRLARAQTQDDSGYRQLELFGSPEQISHGERTVAAVDGYLRSLGRKPAGLHTPILLNQLRQQHRL